MPHNSDKIIDELIDELDGSVSDFNKSIPGLQDVVFSEVVALVKDLEITNGRIANSVSNLRTIGRIKQQLQRIILNPRYLDQVRKFADSFGKVAEIQNRYFNSVTDQYSPSALLNEIRLQSIETTLESLTDSGINANVVKPIQDILRQNITGGGTINSYVKQMKDFIVNTSSGEGALLRYAKQITTDSINQYSAQYMQAVSDDLGWEWYEYVGSNLRTSRPFCLAMTKKRYVHISEFPEILNGHIGDKKIPIYERTGLPAGMIPGTDRYNLLVRRGGYNCGHQFRAIPAIMVPMDIRKKFEKAA